MTYRRGSVLTAEMYNDLVDRVNKVYADMDNTVDDQYGYGQELIINRTTGEMNDNDMWNDLISAAKKCAMHQGVPYGDTISDVIADNELSEIDINVPSVAEYSQFDYTQEWTEVSDDYSVDATGDHSLLLTRTNENPVIITLPTEPLDSQVIHVADHHGTFGVNTCTLDGNGALIDGQTSIVLDVKNTAVILEYFNGSWRTTGDILYAYDDFITGLPVLIDSIESQPLRSANLVNGEIETSQRVRGWVSTITHEFTYDFPEWQSWKYFFNSGSKIELSLSRFGGSRVDNSTIDDLIANVGVVSIGRNNVTNNGLKSYSSITGYSAFTDEYELIFDAEGQYELYAKRVDNVLHFRLDITSSLIIDGTLTNTVSITKQRNDDILVIDSPAYVEIVELQESEYAPYNVNVSELAQTVIEGKSITNSAMVINGTDPIQSERIVVNGVQENLLFDNLVATATFDYGTFTVTQSGESRGILFDSNRDQINKDADLDITVEYVVYDMSTVVSSTYDVAIQNGILASVQINGIMNVDEGGTISGTVDVVVGSDNLATESVTFDNVTADVIDTVTTIEAYSGTLVITKVNEGMTTVRNWEFTTNDLLSNDSPSRNFKYTVVDTDGDVSFDTRDFVINVLVVDTCTSSNNFTLSNSGFAMGTLTQTPGQNAFRELVFTVRQQRAQSSTSSKLDTNTFKLTSGTQPFVNGENVLLVGDTDVFSTIVNISLSGTEYTYRISDTVPNSLTTVESAPVVLSGDIFDTTVVYQSLNTDTSVDGNEIVYIGKLPSLLNDVGYKSKCIINKNIPNASDVVINTAEYCAYKYVENVPIIEIIGGDSSIMERGNVTSGEMTSQVPFGTEIMQEELLYGQGSSKLLTLSTEVTDIGAGVLTINRSKIPYQWSLKSNNVDIDTTVSFKLSVTTNAGILTSNNKSIVVLEGPTPSVDISGPTATKSSEKISGIVTVTAGSDPISNHSVIIDGTEYQMTSNTLTVSNTSLGTFKFNKATNPITWEYTGVSTTSTISKSFVFRTYDSDNDYGQDTHTITVSPKPVINITGGNSVQELKSTSGTFTITYN